MDVNGILEGLRKIYLENPAATNTTSYLNEANKHVIEVSYAYADPLDDGGSRTTRATVYDPKTQTVEFLTNTSSEDPTILMQRYSPKGKYKAFLKGAKGGMLIELHGQDGIFHRQIVPQTVHTGVIRKSAAFVAEGLVWNEDETRFMYIADDPKPTQNIFKLKEAGLNRYKYEDIPGERNQGHTNTSIFIFDIPTLTLFRIAKTPETTKNRTIHVMPQFADRAGNSIVCVLINMIGVYEMSFYTNYPKALGFFRGLENANVQEDGKRGKVITPAVVKVQLPKGEAEEIVYFPRLSPDYTTCAYLYAEAERMGSYSSFGFRTFKVAEESPITKTITKAVLEDNPEFIGFMGFNFILQGWSWVNNDFILATTFFRNTSDIFEVQVSTGNTRKVNKPAILKYEASYVVSGLDEQNVLCRRDCAYKNNFFFILHRKADGEYVDIPLYKPFKPTYEIWEELIVIDGVEAVMYGKTDPEFPPEERGCILYIHGGPHSIWVNNFHPLFQHMLHYGHNILNVNYTGSSGRGETFAKKLHGKGSILEATEIRKFVDKVIQDKKCNPDEVKAYSGSYGGVATLRLITTNPELLRSASIFNPPVDANSIWYDSIFQPLGKSAMIDLDNEKLDFVNDIKDEDILPTHRISLLNPPGKLKTEILLFGGLKDSIITPGLNRHLYKMMRSQGNKFELFEYPDEEHIFATPQANYDYFVKSALLYMGLWKFEKQV